MKRKCKLLLSWFLLSTSSVCAQFYHHGNDLAEWNNPFCGGYFGGNFNFGSMHFITQQRSFYELDSVVQLDDSLRPADTLITEGRTFARRNLAINTVGGGVTLGWAWSNRCWYLAAEFNGLFYGNPLTGICGSKDEDINQIISETGIQNSFDGMAFIKDPHFILAKHFENNVRLDGVVKAGFLVNPCTAFYVLGGGSGVLLKYRQHSAILNESANGTGVISVVNNPNDDYCCKKWIGGGTIGFGLKGAWCDCFDLFVEGRYARYQKWCVVTTQKNEVDPVFFEVQPEGDIIPGDISSDTTTLFRTDSYMVLLGANWSF